MKMSEETVEFWDLYDHQRQLTGETWQRGLALPAARYHLVVHVVIFNQEGQLLIQQRQTDKASWPDKWDFAAAGSALIGETTQEAGERETLEELGLTIDLSGQRPFLTVTFPAGFDDYYLCILGDHAQDVRIQKEEVQAYRWVNETEFHELVESGDFIPYFFYREIFRLKQNLGLHLL